MLYINHVQFCKDLNKGDMVELNVKDISIYKNKKKIRTVKKKKEWFIVQFE